MTTAVVVGGGSGIGAAVAERQRLQGVEVLTWDLGHGADIRCDITDAVRSTRPPTPRSNVSESRH